MPKKDGRRPEPRRRRHRRRRRHDVPFDKEAPVQQHNTIVTPNNFNYLRFQLNLAFYNLGVFSLFWFHKIELKFGLFKK